MTMAGNKAIHQLQEATELQDGDLLIISRPSGGGFVDRYVDASTFPQRTEYISVTIPTASVLTLGVTPFNLIAAPPAGFAILVKAVVMSMVSGTTDYTTSTTVGIGPVGGTDTFTTEINDAAASPMTGLGQNGAQLVAAVAVQANAGGVNPVAGDYDLVFQLWYQEIPL